MPGIHHRNRTGRPGGQKHNQNAVSSRIYRSDKSLVHDRRTRDARYVETTELALVEAIGGDPSPQQALICRRAAFKALRCALAEAEMIRSSSFWSSKDMGAKLNRENGGGSKRINDDYLKWTASLREDLKLLGLERKARDLPKLKVFLAEHQQQQQQQQDIEVNQS